MQNLALSSQFSNSGRRGSSSSNTFQSLVMNGVLPPSEDGRVEAIQFYDPKTKKYKQYNYREDSPLGPGGFFEWGIQPDDMFGDPNSGSGPVIEGPAGSGGVVGSGGNNVVIGLVPNPVGIGFTPNFPTNTTSPQRQEWDRKVNELTDKAVPSLISQFGALYDSLERQLQDFFDELNLSDALIKTYISMILQDFNTNRNDEYNNPNFREQIRNMIDRNGTLGVVNNFYDTMYNTIYGQTLTIQFSTSITYNPVPAPGSFNFTTVVTINTNPIRTAVLRKTIYI